MGSRLWFVQFAQGDTPGEKVHNTEPVVKASCGGGKKSKRQHGRAKG